MTIAFFWTQWKKGGKDAERELDATTQAIIATYKERVNQLTEEVSRYREDMHKMQNDIGELKGVLSEKTKQNKEMQDLLLGRNPDVEAFYKTALPVLNELRQFMEKMTNELHMQTEILKNQ